MEQAGAGVKPQTNEIRLNPEHSFRLHYIPAPLFVFEQQKPRWLLASNNCSETNGEHSYRIYGYTTDVIIRVLTCCLYHCLEGTTCEAYIEFHDLVRFKRSFR